MWQAKGRAVYCSRFDDMDPATTQSIVERSFGDAARPAIGKLILACGNACDEIRCSGPRRPICRSQTESRGGVMLPYGSSRTLRTSNSTSRPLESK